MSIYHSTHRIYSVLDCQFLIRDSCIFIGIAEQIFFYEVAHSRRDYPSAIVTSALERVRNIDRETALKPTEPKTEEITPLTLTYHPNNLQVKNIILRNFKLLQTDSESLRNSLVKGSLPSDLQPGTFRCSRKRCNTCPFFKSTTSICRTKGSRPN